MRGTPECSELATVPNMSRGISTPHRRDLGQHQKDWGRRPVHPHPSPGERRVDLKEETEVGTGAQPG